MWNFIDWFRNETTGAHTWRSLPEYFRMHGYTAVGLGKTFHGCFDMVPPWSKVRRLGGPSFRPCDRIFYS